MAHAVIKSHDDLGRAFGKLSQAKLPVTLSWIEGETRSSRMNRLLHLWFKEIAQHQGGTTPGKVKAECNLAYGVPIKRRDDPEWFAAFDYIFQSLNYASKLAALERLDIPVTRSMKVKQLLEYMDALEGDYRPQGVNLTDPEMLKYEGET